jgi:hypothetical protein
LELTETDHEVNADLLGGKISLGWVMLGENCVPTIELKFLLRK